MSQFRLGALQDPHLLPHITHGRYIVKLVCRSTRTSHPSLCSSRTATDPTSASRADNPDFPTGAVRHVHLNRAIEIVIDSIQSLEGAVNNFDQLVFSLIYGRWNTRTEFESLEVSENKY
jgi:hypothetical protein